MACCIEARRRGTRAGPKLRPYERHATLFNASAGLGALAIRLAGPKPVPSSSKPPVTYGSGVASRCCPPLRWHQYPCNRIGRRPHRVRFLRRISISTASDDPAPFAARNLATVLGLCVGLRFGIIIVTVTPVMSRRSGRTSPFCPCRRSTDYSC